MKPALRILTILTLLIATGFVSVVTASGSVPSPPTASNTETSSDYPARPQVNCEETIKPPAPRCANFDCDDPLFKQYPPTGTWITEHCSELTIPFTIYDTEFMGVFGSADLAALQSITDGSAYHPVATDTGRGIAFLFMAFQRDGNTVPYFETGLLFSVNENPRTVPSQNPYVYLSEMFRPDNKMWWVKLLLSHQMPIDYGRELLGYDKNPLPQNMVASTAIDLTSIDQTFRFDDPEFNPIMSGRTVIDKNPAARAEALSHLAAAPGGGDLLTKALTDGALVRVNFVNRDILKRTNELMKSHVIFRVKSIDLGLWGAGSTLKVNPDSDYGGTISRIGFRPMVSGYFPFHLVLDNGHAP